MPNKKTPDSPDAKERTTIIARVDAMRKVKYIAFAENKTQSDVVDEALTEHIAKWEKKNGPVPEKI